MSSSPASRHRALRRPLKSPLAVANDYSRRPASGPDTREVEAPYATVVVQTDRETTLAEFEDYLRTTNNRDGRPYEEKTINAYVAPGKNLDAWLTANEIEGDFIEVTTVLLNRYFREYYLEHGQGGTHTLQRNLIQLFNFLAHEREHPTPYTDGLNRYAEVKGRPKTLGSEFVDDREHDASKRQPAAFPGYLAKDHTGRAAPVSDVITVPSHTKKDNPEGLPSHHPQPQ